MTNEVRFFDYRPEYELYRSEFEEAHRRVMSSGKLILGDEVCSLENEIARKSHMKHAIAVNSGTDALVISLMALGIKCGDEVITVANTAVPTVSAIRLCNAVPRFVDIDPTTLLMDLNLLKKSITSRTKAIIAVHLFGNALNMQELMDLADLHQIPVIEDCAQSQFTKWRGRDVGSFGKIACYSFYPTKNLGAFGDGGMCLTNDDILGKDLRSKRMYGFLEGDQIAHTDGLNSRLDELQAAYLRVKLKHIDTRLEKKTKLSQRYQEHLSGVPGVALLKSDPSVQHTNHLFVVRINSRDSILKKLKERHIYAGVHYRHPIHLMPSLSFCGYKTGSLPHTESACAEVLSLPMYPELSLESVDHVCSVLKEVL